MLGVELLKQFEGSAVAVIPAEVGICVNINIFFRTDSLFQGNDLLRTRSIQTYQELNNDFFLNLHQVYVFNF